jgi:transposase
VSLVVMEAAGDRWKPFCCLLEDGPSDVILVNARHVKNLPGRKSDVSDAAWLAQRRARAHSAPSPSVSWPRPDPGAYRLPCPAWCRLLEALSTVQSRTVADSTLMVPPDLV